VFKRLSNKPLTEREALFAMFIKVNYKDEILEVEEQSKPMLSDLRESGAIEQDADLVMLLFRPAMAQLPTDKESGYPSDGLGIVIVAKHRNGQTGNVYFGHNPSMTCIGNYMPPIKWRHGNSKQIAKKE